MDDIWIYTLVINRGNGKMVTRETGTERRVLQQNAWLFEDGSNPGHDGHITCNQISMNPAAQLP